MSKPAERGFSAGRWYAAQEPRKIVSSSLGEASLTRRDARRRGLHGPEKTPKKKAREESTCQNPPEVRARTTKMPQPVCASF